MSEGYAVIDVETTGLHPGWHHRVVEVAVVRLDDHGRTLDEWCTLVNPDRDMGPQRIHGISAAEARLAPSFHDIAGDLAARLAGNLVVGHNVSFDLLFLAAEFTRAGIDSPLDPDKGLCTMALSQQYLRAPSRSLTACCAAAGIVINRAHSALDDTRASAALLTRFLRTTGTPPPWQDQVTRAASTPWPDLPLTGRKSDRGTVFTPDHFLRLIDDLPRMTDVPHADDYLAVLDQALVDRHLSMVEQAELVAVATSLGLSRPDVDEAHRRYLAALKNHSATATPEEQEDLRHIADLLGVHPDEVERTPTTPTKWGTFRLHEGDQIVFTGESTSREHWEARATTAGLDVHNIVTRKTRLVVAADPDTSSGKAVKAATYGIPVITEAAFARLLATYENT